MTYCKLISYMSESFWAAGTTTALSYTILYFNDCSRVLVRKEDAVSTEVYTSWISKPLFWVL